MKQSKGHTLSRRTFLQSLAAAAALAPETLALQAPSPNGIPLRPLGNSGASVSIVGYGGWDCIVDKTEAESIRLMHEAIDLGITFWDNCWEYHGGRAEEVMGKALESSGRRGQVFLMTKVCARDYEGFQRQFHESLRRLRTDYVDLLQFHAIQYPTDIPQIFDLERGGLKAALEAREAGKLRYLGFSGHRSPETHLQMLSMPHSWDSAQMPLNLLDAHYSSFQKRVLPECRRRGIGVLGMKSLAGQDARLPRELNLNVELCRRYALSLPVSCVICGMQNREELLQMVQIARDFRPLTEEQINQLLGESSDAAGDGHIEVYKDPSSGYGCSYQDAILAEA